MTNLEKLRERMAASKVPALLVSDLPNVGWLSGFSGSSGRVLVTATEALFLTDSRYTIQAQEEVKDMPSTSFASPTDSDEFLAEHAHKMGITRLGFEGATVSYAGWEKLTGKLKGIELFSAPDFFQTLRMVKTADELAIMRRSCALADAAFAHILPLIRPGRSEYDVCLDLEFYMRRQGAAIAFDSIIVSGERSARPHGHPSEKLLEEGDFLTMDFGACIEGYNSDITRTVVVGKPTERHHEVYNAVLEAQLAAIEAIKPGVKASVVDKVARDTLAKYDLAKYFGHGLGHGLGKVVHDNGRFSPTSEDIVEVGQIWTVEPGAYIPGFGGVRIEDDVVVTETGVEVLTRSPKDLISVPTA